MLPRLMIKEVLRLAKYTFASCVQIPRTAV